MYSTYKKTLILLLTQILDIYIAYIDMPYKYNTPKSRLSSYKCKVVQNQLVKFTYFLWKAGMTLEVDLGY